MKFIKDQKGKDLAAHLFRIEYGRIVAVTTKYLGVDNLKIAEDVAQETFYKAVKYWQHNGIPPNPKAWLYVTAKNECINRIKRIGRERNHIYEIRRSRQINIESKELDFSEEVIADEQLKMMFRCTDSSISIEGQLALILKILCGFSIKEISNAFFTSVEVVNKRLVRARKKFRNNYNSFKFSVENELNVATILKAIYLIFNEGYSPSEKEKVIRKELCFEAIRLAEILKNSPSIQDKNNCTALLSLMYLNASRFEARLNKCNVTIEMKDQDRSQWNRELINKGLQYLDFNFVTRSVSTYHILAAISANHCIARNFENTNWEEILSLYNSLLKIEDSPIIRLNRSVALSKVYGNSKAIEALLELEKESNIGDHHLFHSVLAEFYMIELQDVKARNHLLKAISLAKNLRDINFLEKKLNKVVPV